MSIFYTHNEKNLTVFAPSGGEVVPLEEIPDGILSSGALGEGFAILPLRGEIFSPVCGKVTYVSNILNTYRIMANEGYELLIRVGIGSERLLGDGIRTLVSEGQRVNIGTPICHFDMELFQENSIPPLIAVVLRDPDNYCSITVFEGDCYASKTEVMTFLFA